MAEYEDYSKTAYTPRITLPPWLQSISIGHGCWVCSISSYTLFAYCTVHKQSGGMHSDLTHTNTHSCRYEKPNIMHMYAYVKTHKHIPTADRNPDYPPTHQLFTTVRSNENNMSQFEKSICERNLKLWNSIWSLCLCLPLSISFFLPLPFTLSVQKKMQCCMSSVERDDRLL